MSLKCESRKSTRRRIPLRTQGFRRTAGPVLLSPAARMCVNLTATRGTDGTLTRFIMSIVLPSATRERQNKTVLRSVCPRFPRPRFPLSPVSRFPRNIPIEARRCILSAGWKSNRAIMRRNWRPRRPSLGEPDHNANARFQIEAPRVADPRGCLGAFGRRCEPTGRLPTGRIRAARDTIYCFGLRENPRNCQTTGRD